ncbi:MAG: ABC transporter ATP-binding protein [Clostridia bacterium]|nr:ABC transporter ATP-binding protein [Clostridia bacterium]
MKTKLQKGASLKALKRLLAVIGRYRAQMLLSVLLAAAGVVLQLYVPILFGDAIDFILSRGNVDFAAVGRLLLEILLLVALASLATWGMNLINNRLSLNAVRDIRALAIRKLQVLPLSYLDSHKSGDIIQRVIADTDQLSEGLLLGFTQLFSGVVMIAVTLVFMFSKDTAISAMVVALTPLSFLVAKFIAGRSFNMFQKQTASRGRQTAFINEIIGGQKVVKAFGREEIASGEFAQMNAELRHYSERAVFFSSLTNPSTRFVNNIIYALVALVGALKIISAPASLSVGGLTVLLTYANQYMKPFNDISSVVTELQNALACADRVFELIDAPAQSPDAPKELSQVQGSVDIDDVHFSYDKTRRLIEGFSFRAAPGSMVAIVGPTGCGKTTLINLLMRFYDVDAGQIRVDGTPVTQVTRHSLRRSYGMVLQETWLKNATVRENIAFGKPDASEEEIVRAAKDAHSWEFIRRLPQGLDTVLTEGSLSQGQKQLLCITRVMLLRPPMLILDEATSSIDTRTELMIQEAFAKLMQGRTCFIVAHRLSTIRSADCILVMRDGAIVEQGNHDQLLNKGGFYAQLYRSQFAKSS